MTILVTNDDGIFAEGLWALVKELKNFARVTVVAPDSERSASGTAVTLRQSIRVRQVVPLVPGVEAYAVEGTPSDCVILALGKLIPDKVDLVISGINQGKNLGDDVLISGTVGAALQGYLHGCSALAISVDKESSPQHFDTAAKVAALLTQKITSESLPAHIFLNVNLPDLPLDKIGGVQITRLAHQSHLNTVEEGEDSNGKYYQLLRERLKADNKKRTDVWAIEQGHISITPLFANLYSKPPSVIFNHLCAELLEGLKSSQGRR